MAPDQVAGLFSAGEAFIEGTIGAALVALWLLVVALYLARPYMAANLGKFSLRLGADLWWTRVHRGARHPRRAGVPR
ncbi:MAG TPA: hypothetical protein VIM25_01105 [Candidatus Limnocylindrales bacterium]